MSLQALQHTIGKVDMAHAFEGLRTRCSSVGQDEIFIIVKDPETNINRPDAKGLYPIHKAMMIKNPARRKSCLSVLIDRGVDVNVRTHGEGNTPLHIAVSQSHIPTLSFLLQLGPICDLPDHNGKTPYDIADENGSEEVMELLDSYKQNLILQKRSKESFPKQEFQSRTCTIL